MVKPYSMDLRELAVARVNAGESVRSIAKKLDVSVSSVVKWSHRYRVTGSVKPAKMGGYRPKVLVGEHEEWLLVRT
jgi:transposase